MHQEQHWYLGCTSEFYNQCMGYATSHWSTFNCQWWMRWSRCSNNTAYSSWIPCFQRYNPLIETCLLNLSQVEHFLEYFQCCQSSANVAQALIELRHNISIPDTIVCGPQSSTMQVICRSHLKTHFAEIGRGMKQDRNAKTEIHEKWNDHCECMIMPYHPNYGTSGLL